jgi:hypothetical protein
LFTEVKLAGKTILSPLRLPVPPSRRISSLQVTDFW